MSIISNSGNYTYNTTDILNSHNGTIIRNGLTSDVTDTFPQASEIIVNAFGGETEPGYYVGTTLAFTITNDSDYTIVHDMGSTLNLIPNNFFNNNMDKLLSHQSKTYNCIVTGSGALPSDATIDVHLENVIVNESSELIVKKLFITDIIEGDVQFSNVPIVTGTPVIEQDNELTTKGYVDNLVDGLVWRQYVKVVQVGSNYSLLSTTTPEDIDTVNGFDTGDRILLVNQTIATENGIWVITLTGGTYNYTRPDDFNTGMNVAAASMFASEGSLYQSTAWLCTNLMNDDIVDVNDLTMVQWSSGTVGLTSLNGVTGPNVNLNITENTESSSPAISINGNDLILNIPIAGSTSTGTITSTDQAINGIKTFLSTTNSTSKENGSIIVKGGVGIEQDINAGGDVTSGGAINANGDINTHGVLIIGADDTKQVSIGVDTPISSYSLNLPNETPSSNQILTINSVGNQSSNPVAELQWRDHSLGFYYNYGPLSSILLNSLGGNPVVSTEIMFGASTELHQGDIITYSNNSRLMLKEKGFYKISYSGQFQSYSQDGAARGSVGVQIRLNNSVVLGSMASCYLREQGNDLIRPGAGKTIIVNSTNDNSPLAMECLILRRGTITAEIQAFNCSITVELLKKINL